VTEYVVRFLAGGLLVSMFAVVGDIVRSKSFAGLFEAAPSVALATLGIAWFQHGGAYAGLQAHSMSLGGVSLACYSVLVCHMLMSPDWRANRNACRAAGLVRCRLWLVWRNREIGNATSTLPLVAAQKPLV
jgi:hypothetical protein